MNDEPTLEDLHKALAAFLICFGSTMPRELGERIAGQMTAMADRIESGGEPIVAMLTRDFADALLGAAPKPRH